MSVEGLTNRVRETCKRVNSHVDSTNREVHAVRASWQGDAQQTFERAYTKLEHQAKGVNNEWMGLNNKLQDLSQYIQRAEREKKEKLKAKK